jgi:hypothetical protein
VAATAVAAALLSPWVTLLFGAALVPLSWAFLAAVPAALLTIVLIHHGGIARDWWRRLPPFRSMGWIGLSFLVLSLAALSIADGPLPVALVVVVLGGVFNAWAWERSVRSIVIRPALRRAQWVPATAIAVTMLLVVVFGGTRIGFLAAADADDSPVAVAPDAGYRGVLLVPGFGAECCDEVIALRELAPDLLIEQYSYLGLDRAGEPVPHSGDATDADLGHLAAVMAEQVEELYRRTGRPVAIVAESEGTLVAAVMLERHPDAPADHLALLSPIVAPGRVTFPDRGEEGPGVVAGWQLRALGDLIDDLAPIPVSADGPLTGSLRKCRDEIQTAIVSDRPGIEEIAIVPLADSLTSPAGTGYGIDTVVVPGFHGGLRGRPQVQEMLISWLAGADLDGSDLWAVLDRVIAGSASAWRVPPLGPYADPAPAALTG